MKVSAAGRAALTAREGRRLVAYQDSVGVWTIGVGHTGRMSPGAVTPGMRITAEQCDAFLEADLAPVEDALAEALKVPVTQNQFDALASFLFNVGIGWAGVGGHQAALIFRKLNAGDVKGAADAFDFFHFPPVLVTRRNGEKAQFLTPDAAPIAARPTPSAASPIVGNALNPKAPGSGTSPALGSATPATPAHKESTMGNLLGSVASIIEGIVSKGTTVATVATVAPTIIEGAFKSVDEAERGFKALAELVADIRGGKWQEVPDDINAIIVEFRQIMINFGIDHDKLNVAATKIADLDSVATLKKAA